MNDKNHAFAVILAGGGGTRLWPKSRNATPKQFLKLTSDLTMVQVAGNRVTQVLSWDHVIVVTNKIYVDDIKAQLPLVPSENIIAEPEKKDTALAMLVGALYAKSKDPDAVIMNGASDHVITDEKEFVRVMNTALEIAEQKQNLVTVGITPTRPDTAFGYIKISEALPKVNGVSVFKVDSFTEKPNEGTARAFLSTGKYFWNANMYVWSVSALEAAFQQYMPEMYERSHTLATMTPEAFHAALPEIYAASKAISIDYAISEKANNLVLIPGDFGWNDVGDWKVVYDLNTNKKNNTGNVCIGENVSVTPVILDGQNNLIHSNGRLIAMSGISDMIVVDTGEIILIIPKDKSQDVKKIVEKLKADNNKNYL